MATVALKYSQSNSVCYARDGQVCGGVVVYVSVLGCRSFAGDWSWGWATVPDPLHAACWRESAQLVGFVLSGLVLSCVVLLGFCGW